VKANVRPLTSVRCLAWEVIDGECSAQAHRQSIVSIQVAHAVCRSRWQQLCLPECAHPPVDLMTPAWIAARQMGESLV
jgi:hypothetical protein